MGVRVVRLAVRMEILVLMTLLLCGCRAKSARLWPRCEMLKWRGVWSLKNTGALLKVASIFFQPHQIPSSNALVNFVCTLHVQVGTSAFRHPWISTFHQQVTDYHAIQSETILCPQQHLLQFRPNTEQT
jgi:hypothetical protein